MSFETGKPSPELGALPFVRPVVLGRNPVFFKTRIVKDHRCLVAQCRVIPRQHQLDV